MTKVKIFLTLISLFGAAYLTGHSAFTGYSGAPTSNGTCTSSCHRQTAFIPSCEISGFPAVYEPGRQYLIRITHSGDRPINQFNCSIRSDSTNAIAGIVLADTNTAVYSIRNESLGVHWASADRDSGTFVWQAPDSGLGPITLYWAGLQGNRSFGADQQIVLHALQQETRIDPIIDMPIRFDLRQNYPNPFNSVTVIDFSLAVTGDVAIDICNILGQPVCTFFMRGLEKGGYALSWNGCDNKGKSLPSGLYFYQLTAPEGKLTRKLTILR